MIFSFSDSIGRTRIVEQFWYRGVGMEEEDRGVELS